MSKVMQHSLRVTASSLTSATEAATAAFRSVPTLTTNASRRGMPVSAFVWDRVTLLASA